MIEKVGDPDPDLFGTNSLDPIDSGVADPGSGAFLTPGTGMEKNTDPDHNFKSLVTILWINNT